MDSFYITRREFHRYVRGAAVAFAVMLGSVGYVLSTKPDIETVRSGLVSSCGRVNVLRAQSNLSDNVSFKILSAATARENALVQGDAKNAKIHKTNAAELSVQAHSLAITDLTKCGPAVNDPDHYMYPIAIPIGDPETGEYAPGVERIVDESRKLLVRTNNKVG